MTKQERSGAGRIDGVSSRTAYWRSDNDACRSMRGATVSAADDLRASLGANVHPPGLERERRGGADRSRRAESKTRRAHKAPMFSIQSKPLSSSAARHDDSRHRLLHLPHRVGRHRVSQSHSRPQHVDRLLRVMNPMQCDERNGPAFTLPVQMSSLYLAFSPSPLLCFPPLGLGALNRYST